MMGFRRVLSSVRSRLVLLVLIILIPLAISDVAGIVHNTHEQEQRELETGEEFANAICTAFGNYLDRIWSTERAVGSALIHQGSPMPVEAMELLMRTLLPETPVVRGMSWVSPDGVVVATTEPWWRGGYVGDRDYFQRAVAGQDEVISDLIMSRSTGEPTIALARAIRQDGQLMGVVYTSLRVTDLGEILPIQRGGSSAFGLVDREGRVVFHSNHPGLPFEARMLEAHPLVRAALAGQVTLERRYDSSLTHETLMVAAVPIPKLGWAAFSSAPVDEVLRNALHDAAAEVTVLLLAIVLALTAALAVGERMLTPILALEQAAKAVAQGKLETRVSCGGTDELAQVVTTFNQMAAGMQAAAASRNRFIQVAAHELRNPMAGVKGALALLGRRLNAGRPTADLLPLVEVMEGEIDRLSTLLDEILHAFRLRDGHLTVEPTPTDMAQVIHAAVRPLEASAELHHFSLQGVTPGVAWVSGDRLRLEEVLRNLLSNAVKYSPDGGEIGVRLEVSQEHVTVSVSDTGIGVPEEQQELIFHSFVRGRNLDGHDPGGLGLGLYLCREIVQRHGGTMGVQSQEGHGSTFWITLPLSSPA